ncbi:MAG TPA: SRPBCC domain-containing protein [Gammaproteobacteria bacterium]|jgi:uncharacterized protein YndB with AHSA1/START domain|nr:SRPBCC domain-containing protein [Gammaproteobacteria bacterium]
MSSNIMHSIAIKTTPARAYEAVTTERGLAGWYTPATKAEPRVGGTNEFTFGDYGALRFRVEKLEPSRHVDWVGVDCPPEWKGSHVSFDIKPEDENTITFTFSHTGLPSNYDGYACFNYLWGQYVRSIKLLLETGAGEPFGSEGSKTSRTTPTD